MDRAIYKQKIIDIVTEMKSRLTDPNNTATEDFAEGFTVALEMAGIISVSFVEELPDEGVENVLYIDKVLLQFAIWQDDDWDFFSSGSGSGITFTDLVAILQEGTNVTLDVDTVAETITINSVGLSSVDWDDINEKPIEFPPSAHEHIDSEVELTETYTGNLAGAITQKDANDILDAMAGSGGGIFIRRSFFVPPFTSYRGFAPENSLETDAVWTITKTVENANGTIFSNEQVFNHKWTEINTI